MAADRLALRLAATFTAEPLAEILQFWAYELHWDLTVEFAPHGQVFQQLLRASEPVPDRREATVLLLRQEDWLESPTEPSPSSVTRLREAMSDLGAAVCSAAESHGAPVFVILCPSALSEDVRRAGEDSFRETLGGAPGVSVVSSAELSELFPDCSWHSPYADQLGAVSYTDDGFAALGKVIARKVHAWATERPKVIVVDCDNTLWDGEVAEGEIGVCSDRQELQRMLVRQVSAGRLVCLCSRNSEEDVTRVLAEHPEMVLRAEHVTATKVNWKPKSANLRELADELDLGLDSLLFLDDDPLQVAEVRAHVPEVLALRLPATAAGARSFVEHCWPLDTAGPVTAEDLARTPRYRDNHRREAVRRESTTLATFLDRLELEVDIRSLERADLERAAQLTQRTNQFNLTGRRRSARDVQYLVDEGTVCLVVDVSDRFGSYGLVGLMMFDIGSTAIQVDTFLLSCRALGRGVEHQMLNRIGRLAAEHRLSEVRLPFVARSRNAPAKDFLDSLNGRWETGAGSERTLVVLAARAAEAHYDATRPPEARQEVSADTELAPSRAAGTDGAAERMQRVAGELATPRQVAAAFRAWRRVMAPPAEDGVDVVAPRTPLEAAVLSMWQDLLSPPPQSVHDDFFQLSGTSLTIVRFMGLAYERFGVELPLGVMFAPSLTVAEAAAAIEDASEMFDEAHLFPTGGPEIGGRHQ